jgi:catechol O-methyltransferase
MALPVSPARADPFYYRHVPKNILLSLLSLFTLPFSATLVIASLLYSKLFPQPRPIPLRDASERKTILVTGVSMTKGLTIARILAQHTPHRVIGADTSGLSPGRFSSSLAKFYVLTPPDGSDAEPYIDSLLNVIKSETVDLWISCSSVLAAVEDGEVVRLAEKERGQGFQVVQFRSDVVERLHEKDHFIDYIRSLNLPVPESHRCTSSNEVIKILTKGKNGDGKDKKFILKPIGVDDRARANMMTLLPFEKREDTISYVKNLRISSKNAFQVQQFISGAEYCTHALVIRGRVVAFTCCPSSELLMHYEAIPPSSHLFQQMLEFTQRVAEDGGESFSGHLSFDFLAEGEGKVSKLYPIECNPRAHTAVALFSSTPQMASAYLSAFEPSKSKDMEIVTPRSPTPSYYWLGHDIVALLILPTLDLLWGIKTMSEVLDCMTDFWEHVASWRDGTFTIYDPVPFFVLYHVYWPMRFLTSLGMGKGWSRINVSTTKVFEQ